MAERVPTKIGKYPVIEKIAEGGMGAVYKAKHPTLDRYVIIKKLTILNNPQMEGRFKREASIMMDLKHENIVQVYDHFREGSVYYIVMEYVDGTDLLAILKRHRYLPNYMSAFLIYEVAKALDYAHKKKVIHRDIKPANVLVSKDGEVKLTDFGVASQFGEEDELTNPGMTIGTPAYMAPEQIADPTKVDPKVDIYSLGVVLYELVVGQKPFQGGFSPETISKVSRGKYPVPRKINPKVLPLIQRIIKKVMHHKQSRRYTASFLLEKLGKKFSHLKKAADNREWLVRLMNGEDVTDDQMVPIPNKGLKTFFKVVVNLAILGSLSYGGYYLYREGYQYRYLTPKSHGAVQFVAGVRKNEIYKTINPPQVALFFLNGKKWIHYRNINIDFDLVQNANDQRAAFSRMKTGLLFLPKGHFKARIDIANEQFYQEFMVNPWSMQTLNGKELPQQMIYLEVEKEAPRVPLKMKTDLYNTINHQQIDSAFQVEIYEKGWIVWDDYQKQDTFYKTFVSGKDYSFKVSAEGFHSRYVNITVGREQSILNLSVPMIPVAGRITVRNNFGDVKMTANNLAYRYTGNKKGSLEMIPLIKKGKQSLSFAQGEYYLSFQENAPWYERLVLAPPFIRNPVLKTLPLKLKPAEKISIFINPDDQHQNQMTLTHE